MPHALLSQVGTGVITLICVLAMVAGGLRERIAGALFLVAALATLAAQRLSGRYDPVWAFFGIDLVVWLGLLGLCWRSPALWPFAATAFQGIAMAAHVIRVVRPGTRSWTYITVLSLTSDAAVIALALGVWAAVRRRRTAWVGGRS